MFRARERTLPDEQARSIVVGCCLVLAAYRYLKCRRTPAEAFESVRAAMYRTLRTPMRFMVRAWLWLTRNPLKRLGRHSWMKFSQRMYGAKMQFDQEETEHTVDLLVRRCAFHEFFVEHGEPELTRVFCEWDRNWMDIVNEPGRAVRAERPSTISTGGDCCRFRIVRADKADPAGQTDIVLLQTPATRKNRESV